LHCCPEGYSCDSSSKECIDDDEASIPWLKQLTASRIVRKFGVKLTGGQRECSNGDLCSGEETW
jgi:hypothetical protein